METEDIQKEIEHINQMSLTEMVWLLRFGPAGHSYFGLPLVAHFEKRFREFDGRIPVVSDQETDNYGIKDHALFGCVWPINKQHRRLKRARASRYDSALQGDQ